MVLYKIGTTLHECSLEESMSGEGQYVGLLSPEEWAENRERFDLGIDMDMDLKAIKATKAEVNYDSLTGTLCLPDRRDPDGARHGFAFALDEKGILFIDSGHTVERLILEVMRSKKWKYPSLERFLYDFLEEIIHGDLKVLEQYEEKLDTIEDQVFNDKEDLDPRAVNEIRNHLRTLRIHYEQLMDLGQELEENENSFFREEDLRFFHMFTGRVTRLHTISTSLRDYAMQLRDLYQAQIDVKQNRIMTVLTVVTTIFMPLTLIAGWYGMNFQYMPELSSPYGYIGVIVVSVLVVVVSLLIFKKKKWL